MTNSNERKRIDGLLNQGKISENDHRLLLGALEKKVSPKSPSDLLINPFQHLSVTKALLVGATAILIIAFLGSRLAVYFPGVLDFQIIQEGKRVYSFNEILIQNVVNVLVLSFVYYAAARLSRQRNLRLIDFVSSSLFTRTPYAVFLLVLALMSSLVPGLLLRQEGSSTPALIVFAFAGIGFLIWALTYMFFAFKEASGVKGKALWFGYIFSLFIAEGISYGLNAWILK